MKTVLQVMDGLRGVWHGGPFSEYAKIPILSETNRLRLRPVAVDRLLIDVIEKKRKSENAISVFDRSMDAVKRGHNDDPNVARRARARHANHFIPRTGAHGVRGEVRPRRLRHGKIHVTEIEDVMVLAAIIRRWPRGMLARMGL